MLRVLDIQLYEILSVMVLEETSMKIPRFQTMVFQVKDHA